MKILIDARELDLIAMFGRVYPGGNPEIDSSQNLQYGDVQIWVDGKMSVMIERKRADDFRSSVTGHKDPNVNPEAPKTPTPAQQAYPKREIKRFWDQRNNMIIQRRENPGLVIMYVFEGSVHDLYYGPKVEWTAIKLDKLQKELVRKYGIPTEYGHNISDTVRSIGHLRDIAFKHGSIEQCCSVATKERIAGSGVRKTVSGVEDRQMMPTQFLGRALVTIHGVTPDKAEVIVRRYHTLPNLLRCYKRLRTEKERKHMLADLKLSDEANRFGPKLSERIYKTVYVPEHEEAPVVAESSAKKARHQKRLRRTDSVSGLDVLARVGALIGE